MLEMIYICFFAGVTGAAQLIFNGLLCSDAGLGAGNFTLSDEYCSGLRLARCP